MSPAFALVLALAPPLGLSKGQASLVPPEPLPLGGYTERGDALFEPGGEELKARALALSQGGRSVVICVVEMLTVPESLYADVSEGLEAELMLIATHTHSAPDSQMLNDRMTMKIPGIATYSRRWSAWYAEQIRSAVDEALHKEPTLVEQLFLTRVDTDLTRGRRPDAMPNPHLSLLRTRSGDVLLTHLAAHGTVLGEERRRLSGDWPGAVMRALGGLAIPGAIGDASPNAAKGLEEYVAKIVALSNKGEGEPVGTQMSFIQQPIEMPAPQPHPEFAETHGINEAIAQLVVGRFAPREASLSLLAIGDLVLIGVPGEPTAEVGRALEAIATESGFDHALVISHCNGWVGYVLTAQDYARGGYEATLAMHGPDLAHRIIEAAAIGLKRLANAGFPRAAR